MKILFFIIIFFHSFIFLGCSEGQGSGDAGFVTDSYFLDVDLSDGYGGDLDIITGKNIKISVRSSFVSGSEVKQVLILTFKGDPEIIPDESSLIFKMEWETNKTVSLFLEREEGVLAFIDNNGDKRFNAGDYFGLLKSAEIEDQGRYILNISSYLPFERVGDQGLNGNEIQVFERIKDDLLEAKGVSMIITRIGEEYIVYSKRGVITFKRILNNGKYEYPVTIISGQNPIENTDVTSLSTYEEEIAAGSNPENTQYTNAGYKENDERISFIESNDTSYPYAYERISQIFDDPNSGDIIGLPEPFGDGLYEIGTHGHLDITQSRAPLVFSGKGVKKGIISDEYVKAVDIAPTLIKAMGGKEIIGVNRYNQLSNSNYLRRQDGDVIGEILNGEVAEYAIIIVSDGLSHTEFLRALADEKYNIPNLKSFVENGVLFKYGHITNYFSVTLPSHTTIGSGVYGGHHGLLNNLYYLRDTGRLLTMIDLGVGPAKYLHEEMETIFEAYHRNFGKYDERSNKAGKFSASVNQPCTRGATYATLESLIYNFSSYQYDPLPVIEEVKQVTSADNTAVNQMIYLFEKGEFPIPNLVMINLTSTDTTGHGWGPHSDMIKRVVEQTDFRIGKIIELYKNAGIFDKTLFIFTADHGMEIQDRNRSFEYKIDGTNVSVPLLDGMGIKYIGGLPFIYFLTMAYKVDKEITSGLKDYKFTIYDEDRKFMLKSARIVISQNENIFECTTDENGSCTLSADLKQGNALLRIERGDYNFIEEKIEIMDD